MPAQLTLRSPKGGRVLAERLYEDGYRIDAVSGWLVVVDRNGSVVAAHAACPGLEGRIVEHASAAATRSQLGEVLDETVEPGAIRGGVQYPPLRVADLTGQDDDEDRFAVELIEQLRRLGDTYGPLGVAIAAATLTDPQVLVRQIVDDHGGPDVLRGVRPPDEPLDHEGTEPLGEQVARLADWIMEHVPGEPSQSEGAVATAIRLLGEEQETLATYRREVDEQTARAEREHAERLRLEREVESMRGKRNRAREHAVRNDTERDALQRQLDAVREDTSPHPIEEDPRRPHLDSWPDDAVLLTYRELRRLIAVHLEQVDARQAARAMLDGEAPLRVREVLS